MKFLCTCCKEEHDLNEISLGASAPVQWHLISDEERSRSELTDDQCIIETGDDVHYFVRACLELPIAGTDDSFVWGVWCSLSERSFAEMHEHWTDPRRMELGPYFAWLCTSLPCYTDTVFLKARVHQREVGQRPSVQLVETEHPLSVHQRLGVDPAEIKKIVEQALHEA